MERAKTAVDCLDKKHIGEMKAFVSPPPAVSTISRVVLIMYGDKISNKDGDEKVWKKA